MMRTPGGRLQAPFPVNPLSRILAMISVEKIGGTSMSRFDDVLRNIMLRDPKHVYGRVYIVSAYAGVTNQLLEHKKTGVPGVYATFVQGGDYGGQLAALTGKLKAINKELAPLGLDAAAADTFLEKRMRELCATCSRAATCGATACSWLRARCWPPSARPTARSTRWRS